MRIKAIEGRDQYFASRGLYVFEAMVENFITIVTIGAYLATLTSRLGISDSMTAVLSSVASLSGLFQIITVFIAHKTPVKRWVVPLQLLAHLMIAGLYLIPVFNIKQGAGIIFFILLVGSKAIKSVISPVKINWFFSLVSAQRRGAFSSMLTAISVLGGMVFSVIISSLFDSFIADGNEIGAFTMLSIVIFVIIILDIIPLIISKERPQSIEKSPSPFSSMREIFSNRNFRTFLFINIINSIGLSISTPFLGTYQINELGFSLSLIAVIDIIVNVVWIASLLIFGRISKRTSYSRIMYWSTLICTASFVALALTAPKNGIIAFTAYRVLSIIHGSGKAIASNNLIFDITPPETRTNALAIFSMISGVSGFLTTLAMTPLFNYLQSNRPTIFGIELYAQQVLAFITLVIIIIASLLWAINYKKLEVRH